MGNINALLLLFMSKAIMVSISAMHSSSMLPSDHKSFIKTPTADIRFM